MISTDRHELVTSKILLGNGPGAPTDQEVSGQIQVIDMTVYKELNKIPFAVIRVVDGSASDSDFLIGNSAEFALGKSIDIQFGYNTEDRSVFKGIIIGNSHVINGSQTLLQVTCKHESVKMTVSKKSRHFNELRDNEIVENILQENGLTDLDIPTFGSQHEQLVQAKVSDWDYILSRIDTNGMVMRMNGSTFSVFKPDPSLEAVLSLTYGEDIISMKMDTDVRTQSTSVRAFSWDYTNQSLLESEGEDLAGASPGNVQTSDLAEINGQEFEIKTAVKLSNEALQSLADAKKQKQALSKIKGKATFMGNSEVNPGDWVELNGVGEQFSGKAFVSAVQHQVRNGNWETEATLGWHEDFYAEKFNSHSASSGSGQFSGIHGLQVGVVTDIMDPLGEGRVKVRLPMVNINDEGIFARVATLDAGNNRGTFFRPEIDDEVIVGFINEDPSHPVVLGMVHSSAKPTPMEPEDSNDKKGYVSRSEIKITIHDGDKSIVIETPGGRKFTMDDTSGTVKVEDPIGNVMVMDDNGISMESPKEISLKGGTKISFAAPEIAIKADMNLSLEASAGLSLKSSGTADLEGAMVNIKGSLVKIN
ncbi:type VI secretion system tip protein VgrG [Aquiflexum gelatinilyticum]|uniref:Type VI secretion system tip protein VgrG n=1 Tax=Aquiflexum gelatinilyticum TaxID=2961943 RepID=A0A9X2P2U6_9BACT|nr:type VI secretion system tip protein VgrG [Aquiflexum gelatinilyticum]MCR9014588.1 type VI secretion system tip protein VgrG [Aquiflexum gelatinilyticum]